MTLLRAETVPATDRRGSWTPEIDARMARLQTPIRRLLDSHLSSLGAATTVTLVPDAHYPYHPSTGMVTDPAVVGATVAFLERETSTDVAVAGTSEYVTAERTSAYLDLDDVLDRFDASLVDLSETPRTTETFTLGDQSVAVAVPDRLTTSSVIPLPTLRPTQDGPIAGGMRTLASHVDCSVAGGVGAAAATIAVDPELAVLDATTVYAGKSYAADTLLAGPTAAVDAVGARLIDRSVSDDPAIRHGLRTAPESIGVEGVDVTTLTARCPSGELPPPTKPHPAVSLAYRTYAAVSGDAVPPQLDGR